MKNTAWALLAVALLALVSSCQNKTEPTAQPQATPEPPAKTQVEIRTTIEPPKHKGTEVRVGGDGVDVRVQDKKGNEVQIHKDK